MKLHLGLAAGVTAALLAVSAQGVAADQCVPGKTGRIAFMLKQQTAFRYLNADVPFFKKTAEAAGYQVLVQSAENDANNQVAQAENVITKGVDAIVIQPVDFHVAAAIATMAAKAGIPLASYDDLILNAKQAAFIGRDPKDGGMAAAKAVLAAVPKGNYVLIGGGALHADCQNRGRDTGRQPELQPPHVLPPWLMSTMQAGSGIVNIRTYRVNT